MKASTQHSVGKSEIAQQFECGLRVQARNVSMFWQQLGDI